MHDETNDADRGAVIGLLLAMVFLPIAAVTLSAAYAGAHLWLVAHLLLRLAEGRYVSAALWLGALIGLLRLDLMLLG
jgi:hypothetical protein